MTHAARRQFTLGGCLLILTVCSVASWYLQLPIADLAPHRRIMQILWRLLLVWELGIIPVMFLRWKRLRS